MSVRMADDGLIIDGKPFPLMSGAVHYWRLEPAKWEAILDQMAGLGLRCLETYVPWSVHELLAGGYDFSGERDVGTFLDLAAKRGLKAIVRPGPHINAEITGFGFPERILLDPELLARGPDGTPRWIPAPPAMFPAVSYAGARIYQEFDRFLAALAPILRSRMHPQGPIIAIQADNEMTLFFRSAAFDLDYCKDSLAEFRQFVLEKHGTLAKINRVYGSDLDDLQALQPPRRFDAEGVRDLPAYLDWAEFKELYCRRAVTRVADLLRSHGLGTIPITHNYPMGDVRSPLDLVALEQDIDLVGIDLYYRRVDYTALKTRCLALSGLSRLPYSPEFGSGCYHAWPPVDLNDQVFTTMAAWMHGIRGFNFYMFVDRERWYGAPIRRDGSLDQARASFFRRFLAFCERVRGSRRKSDTLLLSSRLVGRLESLMSALEPLPPLALGGFGLDAAGWCSNRDLGLKNPPASTHASLHKQLFQALTRARLPFDLGEAGRPEGNLSRYRLVIAPAVALMESSGIQALVRFAEDGGTVVMGPEVPRLDERLRAGTMLRQRLSGRGRTLAGVPGSRTYRLGQGCVIVHAGLPKLAADVAALTRMLEKVGRSAGCSPLPDPGEVEIDVGWHQGEQDLLWLANPTPEDRTARLDLPACRQLRDVWQGDTFSGPPWIVPLQAFAVKPLEVVR